jgi:putative endonuclease
MNECPWFVYIIRNEKGHLYTGITTDLERRFREHSLSKKGAKFFNTGAPVEIVYKKKFQTRSLASKFEYYIKTLTRAEKLKLILSKRSLHA